MRSLTRRSQAQYDLFVLGLLLFGSLLLMAFDRTEWMGRVKATAKAWISFPEKIADILPRLNALSEENARLKTRLGELSLLGGRIESVAQENRRLKGLLNFTVDEYHVIPARIIGRGSPGLPGSIHLDAGSSRGCKKNMVLMTDGGIVGKLISTGPETSVGQMLSDPNFRISARVERSGVLGIVQWTYGNICQMDLALRSDVAAGDRIVTSGYSRIYPPGLTIGHVFEVVNDGNNLFTRAMIRIAVNLDAVSEVLIVSPEPSRGESL